MPEKSVYLIVTGRVQGVAFRYFAQQKANELHIKGWVRNTPDGKIEIEAEGESDTLEIFIDWMKTGPTRARINTFSNTEIKLSGYKNFIIR